MAIRLYSEFLSDQGTQYKIELHDSEWLGGAHQFECDADGFTLNYSGETDDIISPIISSEVEVGVALRTGQVLNYFDALKTFQESRFRVVILKANSVPPPSQAYRERVEADGGTLEGMDCVQDAIEALGGDDYSLYWAGWVMQDLVTLEDASEPYFMRLKAVDGIGRLANIEYTDTNGITQNGLGITRNNLVIYNCLEAIGTSDLWASETAFLETSVDWWEVTKMTYATTDDPLYLSGVDVGLFESKDDNGNTTRLTYFDVLRQEAVLWGARVYIADGRFIFEQLGNRAATSRYVSRYDNTGVVIANPSVSDDIVVDQTSGNARLAGNSWNFLPALKKVSVTYAQRFLSPWYGVSVFDEDNSEETVGFIAGGSGIQFALYGPVSYSIFSSTGEPGDDAFGVSPVFRVQIRIEDSGNPGTYYYYNRAFNGYASAISFGTAGWSTTAGYYYFDIPAQSISVGEASFYELTTISTTDIPVTGTLRILMEHYNTYTLSTGAVYTLAAHQTQEWRATFLFSRVDGGQEPASGQVYTSTNSSTAIASNLSLDLGEVYIADGSLQTGYLVAFNSSTSAWEVTSAWRKGNSGTGVPILKLMTNESLAMHTQPVQRYNGVLMSNSSFQPRREFDGAYWLFSGGKFTANFDEWDVEMFKIARSTTNITAAEPLALDRTPALTKSGGSTPTGGTNELTAGKVGGMQLDATNQKLGPFQEVTTGGKVNGTLEATGNTTLDQKLLVDGGAVLGISGVSIAYQARVEADGGSVESLSCVTTAVYDLSVLGGDNVNILQDTFVSEQLEVQKATALKSTLAVTGASSLSSTLAVSGATTLSSTLGVTGAATMSSTLGVTGNATFVSDADFEGSHTALIQDVTHTDGSEYTVETTDFIVFNKWEGGTGQAYVNLPRVADSEGRMIRFKSDDTIGANTYVTLRPDSGDTSATIDGETSVNFNRSYDGIMVLCHNNQWYIVQRKSK
jgi:hypothetical protein